MKSKKNAAPVLQHQDGVGEQAAFYLPKQKHITKEQEAQVVAAILPHGAENAVSSKELMRALGLESIRSLRSHIVAERAAGALILSSTSGGYFLPSEGEKGREEIRHFVNVVQSKAISLLCAARPARAALRILEGQECFEGAD